MRAASAHALALAVHWTAEPHAATENELQAFRCVDTH